MVGWLDGGGSGWLEGGGGGWLEGGGWGWLEGGGGGVRGRCWKCDMLVAAQCGSSMWWVNNDTSDSLESLCLPLELLGPVPLVLERLC